MVHDPLITFAPRHAQLLENEKLLLILDENCGTGSILVYLDSLAVIENAIMRGRDGARKVLHREKIDKNVLIAYDETKRMLSICASTKVGTMLPAFIDFDNKFISS